MKKILSILAIIIIATSCKKETASKIPEKVAFKFEIIEYFDPAYNTVFTSGVQYIKSNVPASSKIDIIYKYQMDFGAPWGVSPGKENWIVSLKQGETLHVDTLWKCCGFKINERLEQIKSYHSWINDSAMIPIPQQIVEWSSF